MTRPTIQMKAAGETPVPLTIGRAIDNDLVVDHPSVAAHHAQLLQEGSRHRLVDLASTNGTFVNGTQITSQVLNDGNTVHLGSVALEYSGGRLSIQASDTPKPERSPVAGKGQSLAQRITAPPSFNKSSPKMLVVLVGLAVAAAAVVLLVVVETGPADLDPPPTTLATPSTEVSNTPTTVTPLSSSSAPLKIPSGQEPDWEQLARSVVDIWSLDCEWGGSGTIVLDGSYILTNAHVAIDVEGTGKKCTLIVGFTETFEDPPSPDGYVPAETVLYDNDLDLAVLRLIDPVSGQPMIARGRPPIDVRRHELKLGEEISALGYPGIGGLSITYSKGSVAGRINLPKDEGGGYGEFIKTSDLKLGHGSSGGAAFNSTGQFIGVPSSGIPSEVVCEDELCFAEDSSVALIRPSSHAEDFLARGP